jgi:hypothetical protein
MREELMVSENSVLRRTVWPTGDEVTGEWRKLRNQELNDLYSSPNITCLMKSRRTAWAGLVVPMRDRRDAYWLLMG